jgi:hypothetical protein
MVDILGFVVQILVLILVLIGTIFTQKGFSNINRWFEMLREDMKRIETTSRPAEQKKCKKCGKPIEEHTIGEAKKCGGIISEQ